MTFIALSGESPRHVTIIAHFVGTLGNELFAIHGVKLDRSFAMAPSESLMARMLVHAVDMIGSSGREIVVEGVETQERLDLLIDTKAVGFVQGYLISRPLSIEGLVAFLAKHDPVLALASPEREAA